MSNFNWPINPSQSGPIEYLEDGVPVNVSEDTGTPANSKPLPVKVIDSSGVPIDFATAANQSTQISIEQQSADSLAVIEAIDFATQTTLNDVLASVQATQASVASIDSKTVVVDTSDVQVTSSALPTGAATSALQTDGNNSLSSIDGKTPSLVGGRVPVDGSGVTQPVSGTVAVSNFPATQPVSGTVTANQGGTWNINNISGTVSLPTGAATESTLSAMSAKLPATIGQKAAAASLAVVLASDQPSIPSRSPINTNGQCDNTSLTGTSAATATAPANAVGFILEAPSTNDQNIRWRIGGTASTTAGMLMEPGRDTGYVPCSANVSICATVSGTNAFSIQWIMSS